MSLGAPKLISRLTAAGTAVTNTTTETTTTSYSFPANFFTDGKVITFEAVVRSTATNATDTLVVKALFGGTAFVTTTAVDQANDDICVIRGSITVRDADSSGTAWCMAQAGEADATGTITAKGFAASIGSLNFTAALTLAISLTWSVANAGNSAQAEVLNVWEHV